MLKLYHIETLPYLRISVLPFCESTCLPYCGHAIYHIGVHFYRIARHFYHIGVYHMGLRVRDFYHTVCNMVAYYGSYVVIMVKTRPQCIQTQVAIDHEQILHH